MLFNETACASRNVLAVAAWPRFMLNPGEKTEVYVIVRAQTPEDHGLSRPSLIGE